MKLRQRAKVQYVDFTEDDCDELTEEFMSDKTTEESDTSGECVILNASKPCVAPYHKIRTMDAIYAFLCEDVKNQPALVTVASVISAAINRSLMGDASQIKKVETLTLAGTSGCGKTETVNSIKRLLGMDSLYAKQFVFIDGSTMSDSIQSNNLCGAPSGTIGFGNGSTLADRLNNAINKPTMKKHKNNKKSDFVPKPPAFIMLFIDELHMVSLDFMKGINGLIDTAEYAAPNGTGHFIKPPETTLFILFTCNYGAKKIAEMPYRDDNLACKYIDEDMREDDVATYTIGRLGTICPYYPLESAALESLLAEKLESHVQKTPLALSFGKNKQITVKPEAKNLLVSHVLKQINADLGVRGALRSLLQKVDLLAEKAFSILHESKAKNDEELVLTTHSFALDLFKEDASQLLIKDSVIALIKKNPANAQILALCKQTDDVSQTIDSMGIRKGNTELCHFIMPINIVINQHQHHHHHYHSASTNQDIESKIQHLEEKLDHIASLIYSGGAAQQKYPLIENSHKRKIDEELERESKRSKSIYLRCKHCNYKIPAALTQSHQCV